METFPCPWCKSKEVTRRDGDCGGEPGAVGGGHWNLYGAGRDGMCLRLPVIPVFIQQGRRGERSLQALGAACLQQVNKTNYRAVFKPPHVHSGIHTHFLFLPPKTLLMTKQINKQQQKYTKHTTAENNILSQILSVCFQ